MECFLLKRYDLYTWEVLLKPAKRLKIGQKIIFSDGLLEAELIEIKEDGNRVLKFNFHGNFEEILDRLGEMPLPPYISEKLDDRDRYQTVYAKEGESVAAPTAGLHFTEELLEKIREKGVIIAEVFLDVGLGTFRPVQTRHVSHSASATHNCPSKYGPSAPKQRKNTYSSQEESGGCL